MSTLFSGFFLPLIFYFLFSNRKSKEIICSWKKREKDKGKAFIWNGKQPSFFSCLMLLHNVSFFLLFLLNENTCIFLAPPLLFLLNENTCVFPASWNWNWSKELPRSFKSLWWLLYALSLICSHLEAVEFEKISFSVAPEMRFGNVVLGVQMETLWRSFLSRHPPIAGL